MITNVVFHSYGFDLILMLLILMFKESFYFVTYGYQSQKGALNAKI